MNYVLKLAKRIREEVPIDCLPSGNSDTLFAIYAVLLLAKDGKVNAEDVHNAWAAWMSQNEPNHPSVREFSHLSEEVRSQDEPFLRAIHIVAQERAGETKD